MLKKSVLLLLIPILGCASGFERDYEHTKNKVVKIGMVLADGREGSCSGAFINSDGDVLTCSHCLSHKDIIKVYVKTDKGIWVRGTIGKIDLFHDLALIHSGLSHTPFLKLGNQVRRGQQVLTFGAPLGHQHVMTIGWVSDVAQELNTYIIHSAFILPGNSGGPLVDLHGRLVGVNEATVMLNFLVPAAGYYIAIDVSEIQTFLNSGKEGVE